MHCAVNRRAGARQHAHHSEWLVGVFGEANLRDAMAQLDEVALLIAELFGDFGAEHGIE